MIHWFCPFCKWLALVAGGRPHLGQPVGHEGEARPLGHGGEAVDPGAPTLLSPAHSFYFSHRRQLRSLAKVGPRAKGESKKDSRSKNYFFFEAERIRLKSKRLGFFLQNDRKFSGQHYVLLGIFRCYSCQFGVLIPHLLEENLVPSEK